MKLLLLAATGGAIGSSIRYLINIGSVRLLGTTFPYSTFFINITGSFLMGLLSQWILLRIGDPRATDARVFLLTGILGGYTTFSAYSLDFYLLLQKELFGAAAFYLVGSVALAVIGLFLGIALAARLGH